jgi:hypothetical protein
MSVETVDFGWSERRGRNVVSRDPRPDIADASSDIRGSNANPRRDSNFDGHCGNRVLDFRSGDLAVSDPDGNTIDDDASSVKCVMLIAPDEHPPQQLLDLLRQPSASSFKRAEHPLLAVAQLATLERARRMRAEWTPDLNERTVLVVVNRDAWRDLAPLFQTVREVMPSVGIWVCTERVAIEVHAGQQVDASDPHEYRHDPHDPLDPPEGPKTASAEARGLPLDSLPPAEDEPAVREERTSLTDAEMRDLLDLFGGDDLDDPPSLGISGRDDPS